jgi:hypothetical protein
MANRTQTDVSSRVDIGVYVQLEELVKLQHKA